MPLANLLVVMLAVHLSLSLAIVIEPTSQVSFEGEVSMFSCHSNESSFWQVNGEFFDFSQSDLYGFEFSDIIRDSDLIRRVFITASADTNNTVINCLSVDNENNVVISSNATLTVIGISTNFKVDLVDSNVFSLSWEAPATPQEYSPHNYSIAVQYTYDSSQEQTTSYTVPASYETQVYMVNISMPAEWLPLRECTQLSFSVMSNNVLGKSPSVITTWEKPLKHDIDSLAIRDSSCFLIHAEGDSMTALVLFTLPKVCHYQTISYWYSLSLAQTNSAPVTKSLIYTHNGEDDRDIQGQLHNLKLPVGNFYQVHVNAEVHESGDPKFINGPTTICSSSDLKPNAPNIGGLDSTNSDQSPPEILAGIVVGAVLLLAVLSMNIILIVVVQCKNKSK